ncbi:hypothetical protein [Adlercreutzia agrestimuris]|uniref:hypothetical protein n=1 Tax=Adlercreutzia agrestimuris TaxID=2941324 RepID=UPI00203AB7AD|nr:hypothetical protein [Adlercreutzia agrestimuris]
MKKLNSLTNKIATVALAGAIALSSAGVIAATAAVTDPQPAHAANAGWQKSGNRWWYQYSNKSYATGWEKIGNAWYYFYNDGWMAANGWQKVGGNWFWLESSGAMRESSWVQVNGTWYYLKAGGYMATDWQKIGGKWYYLNPSNGAMRSNGWLKVGSDWFWLESSGAARESSWVQVNGTWYYLKAGGYMATGWQKIGGKWYYLNPSNGAMATSKWVGNYYVDRNGVMATNAWVGNYYVNESGVWVPNAKPNGSTSNGSTSNTTNKTKVWVVDKAAYDEPLIMNYQFTKCSGTYNGVRNGCPQFFGISPQMAEKELANKVYAPSELQKAYDYANQTVERLRKSFTYTAHDGVTYTDPIRAIDHQMTDHSDDNIYYDEDGWIQTDNHGCSNSKSYSIQIGVIHYPEEGHWEYR